jgi:major tropism determinant Mtd-like protein
MTDPAIFQLARDLESAWGSENPVLADGEPGFEVDTLRWKVGDGVTAWNDLPYFAIAGMPGGGAEGALLSKAGSADYDFAWLATTPFGRGLLGFADRDALRSALWPGCMVRKQADQVGVDYSVASPTIMTWDQEVYKDHEDFRKPAFPTRLYAPPGATRVRASANINASASTANMMQSIALLKNGAAAFDGRCAHAGVNSPNSLTREFLSSAPIPVDGSGNDYFEISFQVTGDTSINITAAQTSFTLEVC